MSILAIDFDGVIHDFKNPKPGRRMGLPMEGTKLSLEQLKRGGNKIIIHTCFAGDEREKKVVADFMKYYELPYDEITNIKPNADFYLDDKAIKFNGNWDDALSNIAN